MHIHVIHENAAWLEPLAEALDRQALPWRDWFLDRGRLRSVAAAPRGCLLQPHERVLAHPRPPLRRRTDRLGAGLAGRARPPRRQRQPRARPRDQQGPPIRGARSRRHPHAATRCWSPARTGWSRQPASTLPAGAGDPEAEPRRQRSWGSAVSHRRCAGRLYRQGRLRAAGRRHASVAGICARAGAADHPRRVYRRPVSLCGRGRHQRRVRAVPGRCLRRRRRLLPGG